jgi:hypothetical protein
MRMLVTLVVFDECLLCVVVFCFNTTTHRHQKTYCRCNYYVIIMPRRRQPVIENEEDSQLFLEKVDEMRDIGLIVGCG